MQTPAQRRNSKRLFMAEQFAERRTVIHGLLGGKCVVCGTRENLEIDHIDPDSKTRNVKELWSYRWEKLLEEVAKCQLLCTIHHREKTFRDNRWLDSKTNHGTSRSWKRCHCDICRGAHNTYMRDYRNRRRANRGLTETK
jgi:hypothetical protein